MIMFDVSHLYKYSKTNDWNLCFLDVYIVWILVNTIQISSNKSIVMCESLNVSAAPKDMHRQDIDWENKRKDNKYLEDIDV